MYNNPTFAMTTKDLELQAVLPIFQGLISPSKIISLFLIQISHIPIRFQMHITLSHLI